jgi:hypothetical protein
LRFDIRAEMVASLETIKDVREMRKLAHMETSARGDALISPSAVS